jgi:hypothetical protein
MLSQIVYNFEPQYLTAFLDGYSGVLFWLSLGFSLHFMPADWESWAQKQVVKAPLIGKVIFLFLIIVLVMQIKSAEVQPFIYFQF